MKGLFRSIFLMFAVVFLLASITMPVSAQLYMVEDDTTDLYLVDTTNASIAVVGDYGGEMEGLALDATGTLLYAVSNDSSLYSFMTSATGLTTITGSGVQGDRGLAFNTATGILYGSDNSDFGSIDTTTGAWTALASPPGDDTEGLAADPATNTIYGINNSEDLIAYDVGTDTWSTIGPTGLSSANDCGLAYDPGTNTLYSVENNGNLYSIVPATGATTLIGDTGIGSGQDVGLAFVALQNIQQIPTMNEWGMIILMALAGLASVYYLRRQQNI